MTERKRCWRCGLIKACRIYERDRNPRAAVSCKEFRHSKDSDISRGKRMIEFIANNSEKILPTAMIVLSGGAAIVYAIKGDWRKVVYWASGAAIIFSVTF